MHGVHVVPLLIVSLLLLEVLELFWHRRQSHSFRQVGKRIDESSFLLLGVVEGAAISELAFSTCEKDLAWHSLVVRVNGS